MTTQSKDTPKPNLEEEPPKARGGAVSQDRSKDFYQEQSDIFETGEGADAERKKEASDPQR